MNAHLVVWSAAPPEFGRNRDLSQRCSVKPQADEVRLASGIEVFIEKVHIIVHEKSASILPTNILHHTPLVLVKSLSQKTDTHWNSMPPTHVAGIAHFIVITPQLLNFRSPHHSSMRLIKHHEYIKEKGTASNGAVTNQPSFIKK